MTFLGVGSKHLIGHGFALNGSVLMPCIDLPTADLGETHSLQKACKPVAEVSFALLSMFVSFLSLVSFASFVSFISLVSLNIISQIFQIRQENMGCVFKFLSNFAKIEHPCRGMASLISCKNQYITSNLDDLRSCKAHLIKAI